MPSPDIDLPKRFALFDLEWTTEEGAYERDWKGPDDCREVAQIGAIRVCRMQEVGSFATLVRPTVRPLVSDYFTRLTRITQWMLDEGGIGLAAALTSFSAWVGEEFPIYCFGQDWKMILENCGLVSLHFPFEIGRFADIRDYFHQHGVLTKGYHSSTITRAFGVEPPEGGHQGLQDARTVLEALRLLQLRIRAA